MTPLLLTLVWLPVVAPLELALHEGAHWAVAKSLGAERLRFEAGSLERRGVVFLHHRGLSRNEQVAMILAPKVIQLGVMAGGYVLLMVVQNEWVRGLLRAGIVAATFDFACSTGDWRGAIQLARRR